MYESIIQKIFLGEYTNTNLENVDILGLLKEDAVVLGGSFSDMINPAFVDDLKAATVLDPLLGNVTVYDLINTRIAEMSDTNVRYEPFTGPLYAQNGTEMVQADQRMSIFELLGINWFIGVSGGCSAANDDGCVVGTIPDPTGW